nr:LysR family transcriptional regulator [Lachnospiraceae bacterium]
MLNFTNLHYFLVIAEEGSFSKAAKRLLVSQQSLSTLISRMEKMLGAELFERTRPLTLTRAGNCLKVRATQIISLRDTAFLEVSSGALFNSDHLSIGISYAYSRVLLPRIVPQFFQHFPNVKLTIFEQNSQDIDSSLSNGKVDLILGRLPFFVKDLQTIDICEDYMLLMLPHITLRKYYGDHAEEIQTSLQRQTDLQLIQDCGFILTSYGRVRNLTDDLFRQQQISPNILIETETIETGAALCRQGLGALILPSTLLPADIDMYNPPANLEIYPISNLQYGTIAFGYLRNHILSAPMQGFIEITQELLLKTS